MTFVEFTGFDGNRVAVNAAKVAALSTTDGGLVRIGMQGDAAMFVRESFDHVTKVLRVDMVPGFEEQTELRGDVSE